jgi:hypothetical protein
MNLGGFFREVRDADRRDFFFPADTRRSNLSSSPPGTGPAAQTCLNLLLDGTAMIVLITCTGCGRKLKIPETALGKHVKCPACAAVFLSQADAAVPVVVPDLSLDPAPGEAPPPVPPPEEEILDVLPVSLAGVYPPVPVPVLRPVSEPEQPRPSVPVQRRARGEFWVACPWCEARVGEEEEVCPECCRSFAPDFLNRVADRLTSQRFTAQVFSFLFGLPGIGLGLVGWILWSMDNLNSVWGLPLLYVGGGLLWVGIGFGVYYKRDNLLWVLLGLIWIIGLIALAILPDEKQRRLSRIRAMLRAKRRSRARFDEDYDDRRESPPLRPPPASRARPREEDEDDRRGAAPFPPAPRSIVKDGAAKPLIWPAKPSLSPGAALVIVLGGVGLIGALIGGVGYLAYRSSNREIDEAEWKVFSPIGGRCTVRMPGKPPELSRNPNFRNNPDFQGAGQKFVVERKDQNVSFFLLILDLPQGINPETDFRRRYEAERDNMERSTFGTLVKENDIQLDGHAGREFQIETAREGLLIERLYLVKGKPFNRMYLLGTSGRRIKPDKGDAARFFDSFALTPD